MPQEHLTHKERKLTVILAIDRIRDRATDPQSLLTQVTHTIGRELDADLCLLGLLDRTTGRLKLNAVEDRGGLFGSLDGSAVQEVLEAALQLDGVTPLAAAPGWGQAGPQHLLAAPLLVNEERLGVLLLANRQRPFDDGDREVLAAAVSQADSAAAQALMLHDLAQRNRRLQAIYRIDRIRDETSDAQQLVSSVARVATESLEADLCLMSLVNEETGQSELRAIDDRGGLFGRLEREAIHDVLNQVMEMTGAEILPLQDQEPWTRHGLNHALGAPLCVSDEKLGAFLLFTAGRPFSADDVALLEAIVSQTDSAVIHARTHRHLQLRNKELETVYRVDAIRDREQDFSAMLNAVLNELCQVMEAETGFIMLFDESGEQLELRASTEDDILRASEQYRWIEEAANDSLYAGDLVSREGLTAQIRSLLCAPLVLREKIIGVFGAVNRHGPGGFSHDDKRLLRAITSQVDTAIFESLDMRRIRGTFERYVGETVMEEMLNRTDRDFLAVERMPITVLYSDMRGFTSIAERTEPEIMVETLNKHLGAMTDIVLKNHGTLDKFVGDEVVALFGTPLPMDDHALLAVKTALKMQAAHQALLGELAAQGREAAPIGIGINSGDMVVGNIGCEKRVDYTAIGDAMNLGARLCGLAQPHQILISENTFQQVKEAVEVEKLAPVRVKGREKPEQIYSVIGLK